MAARALKRIFYLLIATTGVGLGVAALFLLTQTVQSSDDFDGLQDFILAINLAGGLILVLILIVNLWRLYHDYREGLRWLLLLSLLHVFMEFPLNWRSFMGIGSELMGRIRRYASN